MADDWLPLREASARLGVSTDTLRRRLKRGELAGEQRSTPHGPSWFVQIPRDVPAAAVPTGESEDAGDVRLLEERIAGLTAQLTQAEADRDRWHQLAVDAIDRAHRERDEMRALLGREQAIALSATSGARSTAQADAEEEPAHAQAHDVVVRDATPGRATPQTGWQWFLRRLGF